MKFSLESGHRGLEGISTEGATGWDEVGNLQYGQQSHDDERSMHDSLDRLNALIDDLEDEGLTESVNETGNSNNEDFERNEKSAEEINQEFGHRALAMAEKMSSIFSDEELKNMSLSELSATF